jgi:hypothetical protein
VQLARKPYLKTVFPLATVVGETDSAP